MSDTLSLFSMNQTSKIDRAAALISAARSMLPTIVRGKPIDHATAKTAMSFAFMASDTSGAWSWKDCYDAQEISLLLNARRISAQIERLEDAPTDVIGELTRFTKQGLTHTRRTEESVENDQFSTPLEVGALLALGAQIRPGDNVLEPSAGTGLLAVFAEIMGAKLHLNEIADTRAGLLSKLFPGAIQSRLNGIHLNNMLQAAGSYDVCLTNPPFTDIEKHLTAAVKCLADNGRLCAIVPVSFLERGKLAALATIGTVRAAITLPESAFYKHGTTVETAIVIVDRSEVESELPRVTHAETLSAAAELIQALPGRITAKMRERRSSAFPGSFAYHNNTKPIRSGRLKLFATMSPLAYEHKPWTGESTDTGVFSQYDVSRMTFSAGVPHPAELVESSAMATTAPPVPSVTPQLPSTMYDGALSFEQLEAVIYAAQAHSELLPGWFVIDEKTNDLRNVQEGAQGAFQMRRGFFIGDGTGLGKAREALACLCAAWSEMKDQDQFKAVFVTLNEDLLQDIRNEWVACGGQTDDIVPQSTFKLGATIRMDRGILFTTYGTLRTSARQGKKSRLDQIVDWLGEDFDGPICFDEAHQMANAGGGYGARGHVKPSQQGMAGLLLQHKTPLSRVTYLSATGATTAANLTYAVRLGLWGSADAPFMTRHDFLKAAESGGTAFLEMASRELKAQGLYMARNLSFAGVEIDPVIHELSPGQIEIWDAWADAWGVIWNNVDAALEATGVTEEGRTLSGQAKSAARSAFASTAQRFFNNLLSGMKAPTMIKMIEQDLANGYASVVQLINTNEASLTRRLNMIDPEEKEDLNLDLSTKDVVLNYLIRSFPTGLMEQYTDENDRICARPVVDAEGRPVQCQEAIEMREEMIERLALLPGVPGLLDALIHHFGPDQVAEASGRTRRVVLRDGRQILDTRGSAANQSETQAFMDGKKNILVFSQAGGTGRSYHADRNCKNQRRRRHYCPEWGFRADVAIQGLGRTHRSRQSSAPVFIPVATNIEGERRFLSTIARRLDTLGALTKGERRSAGSGMFRPEDNLEGPYANRALMRFLQDLYNGDLKAMSLGEFMSRTGLELCDANGSLKEEEDLPTISRFLNRLLQLRIEHQNALFADFQLRLANIIEAAEQAGKLDRGIEDLVPNDLELKEEQVIRVDKTGAETRLIEFEMLQPSKIVWRSQVKGLLGQIGITPVFNKKSKAVGLAEEGHTTAAKDDCLVPAIKLYRPTGSSKVPMEVYQESAWEPISEREWETLWERETQAIPAQVKQPLYLLTGLLLPIWKMVSHDHPRIRRLKAPDGRRWLGRVVDKDQAEKLMQTLGIATRSDLHDPMKVMDRLENNQRIKLKAGLWIKRVRFMHDWRFEIYGNTEESRRLKSIGCFVEIVQGQARLFIPSRDVSAMRKVLEHYPAESWVDGPQSVT